MPLSRADIDVGSSTVDENKGLQCCISDKLYVLMVTMGGEYRIILQSWWVTREQRPNSIAAAAAVKLITRPCD